MAVTVFTFTIHPIILLCEIKLITKSLTCRRSEVENGKVCIMIHVCTLYAMSNVAIIELLQVESSLVYHRNAG